MYIYIYIYVFRLRDKKMGSFASMTLNSYAYNFIKTFLKVSRYLLKATLLKITIYIYIVMSFI